MYVERAEIMNTIPTNHQWSVHIGCIDGRGVAPVQVWAMAKFGVLHVDAITQGGMDGFLSSFALEHGDPHEQKATELMRIKRDLFISLEHHKSWPVIVSGHYACAGNPVSDDEHKKHIRTACSLVRSWGVPDSVEIIGVFVNSDWQVEKVT